MEVIGGKEELTILASAARLYKFLLDMGLATQHAISAVETKYQLTSSEKNLFLRCISSEKDSREILRKVIRIEEIDGTDLAIDFYNVIITISEALEGYSIFRCTDGLIRDLASVFGRSKKEPPVLSEAMKKMNELIISHRPRKVIFVADKQISHSAERLTEARNMLSEKIHTEILLVNSSDSELIKLSKMGHIVATSDVFIAKNSEKILDIPRHFLLKEGKFGKNIVDMSFIIYISNF
ncbi:MAG: DUF434 domain-containing protein [Fervidicoccaceae archaeon]